MDRSPSNNLPAGESHVKHSFRGPGNSVFRLAPNRTLPRTDLRLTLERAQDVESDRCLRRSRVAGNLKLFGTWSETL